MFIEAKYSRFWYFSEIRTPEFLKLWYTIFDNVWLQWKQENNLPDIDSIADFSVECSVPFTVGGGITEISQILALLHAGADKISINSSAYTNPNLSETAAKHFGAQCIVASIDVKKMICYDNKNRMQYRRYYAYPFRGVNCKKSAG